MNEIFAVRERWGVSILMRDGVRLVGDVYLPDEREGTNKKDDGLQNSWPAIVVRTPYGRSSDDLVDQGRYFAAHGYAVLQLDVRGRGDSEGEFIPYRNEGRDGYDTIEWTARQPWCNGNVGTLGGSYLGRIQWLTALHHPPHLKAMIPLVAPSDPFVEWPTGTPGPMHLCWLFLTSGRTMQNMNKVDWSRVYSHLPLRTMDEVCGRSIPAWSEEIAHPYLDDWWRELSYQSHFNEINLPVLHISGWYDDEQIGTPLNFTGMVQHAPSEWARQAQRLVMGPWGHRVNESTRLGSLDFGPDAVIDLLGLQVRFFDRWLKGQTNGIDTEPRVSYFVMGMNQWQSAATWPPQGIVYTPWYLSSNGHANGSLGEGVLIADAAMLPSPRGHGVNRRKDEPSNSEKWIAAISDTYSYNPRDPVPFLTEPTSSQIGGPDDYQTVHQRRDVLVYTSATLTESVQIVGPVKVELYAKTSAPDTDFMAQLHDVWPNGYAQRLCDGMVRSRFRHGMDQPELLSPNELVKYVIDLWNTAHVFLPGHRIRVHVTSSAFPKYDRNPNTADDLGTSEHMEIAVQTVYHDSEHPSAVILPMMPGKDMSINLH